MVNDFVKFEKELADLRARLGRHKLAPHFTGSNLSLGGEPLPETIEIEDISVPPTLFSGLFLLPDDARPNSESWQVLLAYIRSRKEFE